MAMAREVAGRTITTHYFSTLYEARKYVGQHDAQPGWYYQEGVDPKGPMRGPFRVMVDMLHIAEKAE